MSQCFITGEKDCELTEINYNSKVYLISDAICEEMSFKKLCEMINKKEEEILEKSKEEENKKNDTLNKIKELCAVMGITPQALSDLIGGSPNQTTNNVTPKEIAESAVKKCAPRKPDGFKEVDGSLRSDIKIAVKSEGELPGAMPGYSSVKDGDRTIRETNKKVKRVNENTIVEKSDMGTTVIQIDHRSGREIEQMLRQVDENGELVRAAVAGSGRVSGKQTISCPLCGGTGISKIGYENCKKCEGSGIIYA